MSEMVTQSTKRDSVRLLCKSIVTRLENRKAIEFPARLRQIVADELFSLVGPYVLTDEDLRDRTLARIGAKAEMLENSQFTDSDQYKAAKAVVRSSFGDDELNGFYFQKPLKTVASSMAQYFMRSSHIDDVYESDEEIEKDIVEMVKKFNPADAH
jgi:hypothetical protein